MDAVKSYFKSETRWEMLGLEHTKPPDFYLSVWQTTRSSVPLLIWRALLFLASLGIILTSFIMYAVSDISIGFWFIYLTHWGLTLNVFATGFATVVSARCYLYGPISAEFCLPWYVKTYWVFSNAAVPIAFLITVFYWTVLYGAGIEEEVNHALDVAIHGINSVVMFLLLISSSHACRLLHFYQPICFAFTYVVFAVIYYLAGGRDAKGNAFIYPVLYWGFPGQAIGVVVLTGLLLVALHFTTVGLAASRNAVATRLLRPSVIVHADEGIALRTTNVA
ncbi:protein rolling stone-like [Epargyreus clarus]|uniref:protein rolling stone-like n=1 Tax=Epargyreus clarus TaxID=520877 RepID=UPI003C2EC7AC